jgi:hypothetical protein
VYNNEFVTTPLILAQIKGKPDETYICGDAQGGQCDDGIAAGTEFPAMKAILPNFGEELSITLLAAEQADDQDASPVDGEQGPDAVKLGGEDPQDDESKGEL